MISDDLSDRFDAIIEEAIAKAERVECSLEEYYLGLRQMRRALDQRMECVNDELREDDGA